MLVSVLTEDGHTIQISDDLLPLITLVSRTVQLKENNRQDIISVPLPKIRGSTFARILEWAGLHRDDPTARNESLDEKSKKINQENEPIKLRLKITDDDSDAGDGSDSDGMEDEDTQYPSFNKEELDQDVLICPADRRLLDSLDIPSLIDLTAAANYLAMEPLLDVCCKAIANHMTGLSVEELRLKFNIPNDFTPEEEAKLKAEFGWADE